MRLETLAGTRREFEALKDSVEHDPRFQDALAVYFQHETTSLERRAEAHSGRLSAGQEISTRVID
jgi:hypothetical protein